MAPRGRSREPGPGQEMALFAGNYRINNSDTRNIDAEQARAAAIRRRARRDELALHPRDRGFLAQARSLWVPHTGGENTLVAEIPEQVIFRRQNLVRGKVIDKYTDDPEVSAAQALQWADFAARSVEKDFRRAIHSYQYGYVYEYPNKFDENGKKKKVHRYGAWDEFGAIHLGLGEGGEVERDYFESNDLAMNGLRRYVVHLGAFAGLTLQRNGQRRNWPRESAEQAFARRLDVAQAYLDRQPEHAFQELVAEAYWSERCRAAYWKQVDTDRKKYVHDSSVWLSKFMRPLPLWAYDGDPQGDERYYKDNEFIG